MDQHRTAPLEVSYQEIQPAGVTSEPVTAERADRQLGRRAVLLTGLAGTGAVALAACGSSATTSPAKGATSGTTDSSSKAGVAGAAHPIVTLTDLAVGGSASAVLADGSKVLVTRTGASAAVCFSAICTHEGCTVKPEGSTLNCPCHQSMFNARTGAVLSGPAPAPLPSVAVKVVAGQVVPG